MAVESEEDRRAPEGEPSVDELLADEKRRSDEMDQRAALFNLQVANYEKSEQLKELSATVKALLDGRQGAEASENPKDADALLSQGRPQQKSSAKALGVAAGATGLAVLASATAPVAVPVAVGAALWAGIKHVGAARRQQNAINKSIRGGLKGALAGRGVSEEESGIAVRDALRGLGRSRVGKALGGLAVAGGVVALAAGAPVVIAATAAAAGVVAVTGSGEHQAAKTQQALEDPEGYLEGRAQSQEDWARRRELGKKASVRAGRGVKKASLVAGRGTWSALKGTANTLERWAGATDPGHGKEPPRPGPRTSSPR